jgi:hypothetical protein
MGSKPVSGWKSVKLMKPDRFQSGLPSFIHPPKWAQGPWVTQPQSLTIRVAHSKWTTHVPSQRDKKHPKPKPGETLTILPPPPHAFFG